MGASCGGAAEGRHLQSGVGAAEDRYEGSNGRGESKQCGGDGAEAAAILEEAGGMCAPGVRWMGVLLCRRIVRSGGLPACLELDYQRDQSFLQTRTPLLGGFFFSRGALFERKRLLTIYCGYRDDAGGKAWNWRAWKESRGN